MKKGDKMMRFFHTADWHLGKLVQGVYMTEDQRYILKQFVHAIAVEQPDAVIIAGDLYDRAIPPTEAIHLLDEVLEEIVLKLNIPVLAIGGNHDSPSRLQFGSKVMKTNGLHIVGRFSDQLEPVILKDEHGEVHFYLVPYTDPSTVRNILSDDSIRTHDGAAQRIVQQIVSNIDPTARNIFVGHAFVTPFGNEKENTSDSERPLSIGGAEYVHADYYSPFDYTALGHLHQAHYVANEKIRYAGSILKYSISEEHHRKGFNIVEMDGKGNITVEKRNLLPKRDMRTIEGTMDELLTHSKSEDYVFVRLTDKTPVLSPMEKIRSIYPNALHVERKHHAVPSLSTDIEQTIDRNEWSDLDLFQAFYKEVNGGEATKETMDLFKEVLDEMLQAENEKLPDKKQGEFVSS